MLIYFVSGVALVQMMRLGAYDLVLETLSRQYSEAWLFPAIMDVTVGALSGFISYGLVRREGLFIWTASLLFFCLSISDQLNAITVIVHTDAALPEDFPSKGVGVAMLQRLA